MFVNLFFFLCIDLYVFSTNLIVCATADANKDPTIVVLGFVNVLSSYFDFLFVCLFVCCFRYMFIYPCISCSVLFR